MIARGYECLPDAGQGMCCLGAAARGPSACTCWAPVYDQPQKWLLQHGPPAVRATACDDCAFRPGSPERSGDARFAHSDEGALEEIVYSNRPFACHQGMRRLLRLIHPSGVVVEQPPCAYEPPIGRDGTLAYLANGEPAQV